MDVEKVAEAVEGVPHIAPASGRRLYEFVLGHDVADVLELGTAHGVSACYLAAALHEQGRGQVITLDLPRALKRDPSVYDLLERTGLGPYVTPMFNEGGHTWQLLRWLDSGAAPTFDFCFLDAGHSWDVTGYAFFLVDRVLRPGGWLLFDDLTWTYDSSPSLRESTRAREMPEDQRTTPQVGKVFDLLVAQHPDYDHVERDRGGRWGWAQKNHRRRPRRAAVTRLLARRRGRDRRS